jgi:hypothetical protein
MSIIPSVGKGRLHGHVKSGKGSFHTGVLGSPITYDEALEIQLVLEEIVQQV